MSFWSDSGPEKRGRLYLWASLIFLCPFLFYHRTVMSNLSTCLAIGNDFVPLYYKYKIYLLDFLASFDLPLWSPAEASGYPFYSNPFTQTFYPLNLLLVVFYKLFHGYSIFDHQRFAVLGISIYSLGLFFWLNLHVANRRVTLFAALLVGLSYKLGEILRFPNAIHSAAWMPWILYGIGQVLLKEEYRKGGLVIFFGSLMLLTAGYPYYIYYSLFLIVPYAMGLLFRPLRRCLLPEGCPEGIAYPRAIGTLSVSSFGAIFLSSPYLLKSRLLFSETVNRSGGDFGYSTYLSFGPKDTLGSLIFPPMALPEGWFYFSMIALLLIFFYIVCIVLYPKRHFRDLKRVSVILAYCAFVTYVTYGHRSLLFDLFWHYLPGFSQLRIWARMNVILLPALALLLAYSYRFLESFLQERPSNSPYLKRMSRVSMVALTLFTISIVFIQFLLLRERRFGLYWLTFFKGVQGREWTYIYFSIVSFMTLAIVITLAHKYIARSPKALPMVALVLFLVGAGDLFPVGSSQWMLPVPKNANLERQTFPVVTMVKNACHTPRVRMYDTITLPRFNVGWIASWYFERYLDFDRGIFSRTDEMIDDKGVLHYGTPLSLRPLRDTVGREAYMQLMGLRTGKRLFLSENIHHPSIRGFLSDANQTEKTSLRKLEILHYDGDSLEVTLETSRPSYLSFIDNWDPDWRVLVNGKPAKLERLFGTFKSVHLEPGENRVLFYYSPFPSLKLRKAPS